MDENDALQQRLLSKLSEYGDSLLDEDDYKDKTALTKKITTRRKNANRKPAEPQHQNTTTMKKKKKKMVETSEGTVKNKKKKFESFEDELREFKEEELKKQKQNNEERMKDEGKMSRTVPEVVVFQDPSRRKKKQEYERDRHDSSQDDFNLKKARYEVRQFGLTGFSFEDRAKCEADRAVSLGAWAPKQEYINYKDFIQIQKKKKEDDRQQREIDRKMGYSVAKKPTTEKARVKNQGFWRDASQDKKFFLDGQIGRYKQGVQVISKDEIARVKSKKGGRGSLKRSNKY